MLSRNWLVKLLPGALVVAFNASSSAGAADAPAAKSESRAVAPSQTPADVELPTLRPGMWEYQRSVMSARQDAPQHTKMSKCTDPSEEMRKKLADLEHKGCRFSPTTRSGNTYSGSWACPAHGGLVEMSQVITVTSDSSYEDATEARFQQQVTRTRIVATRVGECPLLPGAPKQRRRPPPLAPSSGG